MDDNAHLQALRAELIERYWKAELREVRGRTLLHVQHPDVARLNDDIAVDGDSFRLAWGQGIGPVVDVPGVADRIQFVLRGVTP